MTSLTINYQVVEVGDMLTYEWTGNLAFLESTEVVLPVDNIPSLACPVEGLRQRTKTSKEATGANSKLGSNLPEP